MNQQTIQSILLFALGLALIIKGGDVFVDTASWMAEASGIPKFIIGATIVSVATTLPELLVSVMAAAGGGADGADMAVGNAIGSVTANTGLILGLSVLFAPIAVSRGQLGWKGSLMLLSTGLLWFCCRNGALSLTEAVLMLLLCVAFLAESLLSGAREKSAEPRPAITGSELGVKLLKFALSAAALAWGSHLLVEHGEYLAVYVLHVPVRVVAITLVAIGTSLPELVTAITALRKKQGAMSVGNILGANIIDITVILPLCALISGRGLSVLPPAIRLDLPVCLAEAALAVVPTLIFKKFHRIQGLAMLALYAAYLVYSIV